MTIIDKLRGRLIVSCQALPEEPLHGAMFMAAMAKAAALGGAGGIRANGEADIAAIREVVALPILGIRKRQVAGTDIYITPEFVDAQAVVRAGADLIALDGTARPRPPSESSLAALIGASMLSCMCRSWRIVHVWRMRNTRLPLARTSWRRRSPATPITVVPLSTDQTWS